MNWIFILCRNCQMANMAILNKWYYKSFFLNVVKPNLPSGVYISEINLSESPYRFCVTLYFFWLTLNTDFNLLCKINANFIWLTTLSTRICSLFSTSILINQSEWATIWLPVLLNKLLWKISVLLVADFARDSECYSVKMILICKYL